MKKKSESSHSGHGNNCLKLLTTVHSIRYFHVSPFPSQSLSILVFLNSSAILFSYIPSPGCMHNCLSVFDSVSPLSWCPCICLCFSLLASESFHLSVCIPIVFCHVSSILSRRFSASLFSCLLFLLSVSMFLLSHLPFSVCNAFLLGVYYPTPPSLYFLCLNLYVLQISFLQSPACLQLSFSFSVFLSSRKDYFMTRVN